MQESQIGGFCSRGDAGQGDSTGPGIDLTGNRLEERVLRQLGKKRLGSHIDGEMNSEGPGLGHRVNPAKLPGRSGEECAQ